MRTPRAPLPRRRCSALLALALLAACTSCGRLGDASASGQGGPSTAAPAPRHTGPAPFDDLAFGLLDRLAATAPGENVVVSPASAGLALSMAAEGAAGVTRDSLAALLGVGGLPPEALTRDNGTLVAALRQTPGVTLTVANAFWGRADLRFDPAFVRRLREAYRAEVATLDLATPAALERINAWARRATAGRIPTVLDEVPADDVATVLTNAVYFKGKWASAFEAAATAPRPFLLPDGSVVPRELMAQTADLEYAAVAGLRLVRLPYRGERIAMYVVLPDTGAPSGALGAAPPELTPEHFRLAAAALERRPVALQLPRFTVDCTADLVAPLSALGAVAAFDPDRADFRPLFAPGAAPRRAWISRVVQRTYVQVNEEGTKAAAVTAIDIATDTSAAPPPPTPFVVDRAFVFAIRDDGTGALLFLGRVADPDRACGGE